MTTPAPAPRSPAIELAETLVPALVAAGLLRDTDADRAEAFQYLTSGTSRPEDWRRLLERLDEPPPKPPDTAGKTALTKQASPTVSALPRPQPPAPIDWLEVSHFRGIGQARWKLPLGGERLVVLTGENGVGKSTILDALDVALRRVPGSVADRFDGAEPPELLRYLPALGKQPADVLLRVQLKNGACWEARLEEELDEAPAGSLSDEEESATAPAGPGRLSIAVKRPTRAVHATVPHVRLLRRQRLLRLLEAHPGQQFDMIRSFVGLEEVNSANDCTQSLRFRLWEEQKQKVAMVEGEMRNLVAYVGWVKQREAIMALTPRHKLADEPEPDWDSALEWAWSQVGAIDTEESALDSATQQRMLLRQLLRAFIGAQNDATETLVLSSRADKLHDIVLAHRQAYTNTILEIVTRYAKSYYASIHPNEDLGPIKWQVADFDQLESQAHYRGHHNVTPQAYFSESHLDTLGFCYWLALARHAAPNGQAILLLDDVFTSADAPHLRRVTELLAAEVKAKRFLQVIITTHNPLWETFFKRGGAAVRALHLYPTPPDNVGGSTVGVAPNRTYADDVRAELTHRPFDPVTAAAKAGILLERLYDEIALLYAVNLPRKSTGYTLNDFGPVRTKLASLTVERTAPDPINPRPKSLAEACTGLNKTEFIRNAKGAHYSPLGELLAEDDARAFAEAVLTLADLLRCPHCRKAPNASDGRQFSCECDQPTYLWPMPTR